ncbi:hypothetical protein SAMN07250955_101365 [Arboricoccus pini]|uniref:SmpA / OmlA family protein n=1 Tax=Arboricoccus pini TaxID=1963835 RepID=A0A212Q2K0_9PROT|nr:hypothetical protein [Arboricoccus pini]SNB53483.1 hypothetical protein SAMN07250955_101365 [Arboricoccus pini]
MLFLGMATLLGACADMSDSTGGGAPGAYGARPVLGMTPAAVRKLLGEPALRRPEPPGDYWRYSLDGCALGLFLFKEQGASEEHVTYYDARSLVAGTDRCATWRARLGPPTAPGA